MPNHSQATQLPSRSRFARVANTLAAAVLASVGLLAIATRSHTGNARWYGIVTVEGEAAVTAGLVLLCLSLIPMAVWLRTQRQLRYWVFACWLLLMGIVAWRIVWPAVV